MAAAKSTSPPITSSPITDPSFEARLEALASVVRALEGEGLTLEDSLARYQEGVEHLRACRALLDGAEARLSELVGGDGAEASETPLRVGADGLEVAGTSSPGDLLADDED